MFAKGERDKGSVDEFELLGEILEEGFGGVNGMFVGVDDGDGVIGYCGAVDLSRNV